MARWDAVVVGGGPAGLSCALWLARYRRPVCVFDTAEPRNEPAWAVHGFPGIPEPAPALLRERIRQQAREAGADVALDEVVHVEGEKNGFRLETAAGTEHEARRIVLAYGLVDRVPDVPGLPTLYGRAVFHCADCDGPEAAGHAVAVIGHDHAAASLASYLLHWTERVTLLTNGVPLHLPAAERDRLKDLGITVREAPINHLDTTTQALHAIELDDDTSVPAQRIFFHLGSEHRTALGRDLGCQLEHGFLTVDRGQETSVPGVYAVGDITGHPHLAIMAAADGVRAALSLHRSLLPPEREI